VLMHGVHILAKVDWDDRKFIVAGLAMLVALGGMFISPEVLAQMPLLVRLFATQPVISGSLTLIVLHALLCGTPPKDTSTPLE
jgi:xanthine/uracil permease